MPANLNADDEIEAVENLTGSATGWATTVQRALRAIGHSAANSFGSAALRNIGTTGGDVPVLGTGGRLDASLFPTASETEAGVVELASAAEAAARSRNDRAVTPAQLADVGGGLIGQRLYRSDGTWSRPTNCTYIRAFALGGRGGRGAGGSTTSANAPRPGAGAAGGNGAASWGLFDVSAFATLPVRIGGPGGNAPSRLGGDGGDNGGVQGADGASAAFNGGGGGGSGGNTSLGTLLLALGGGGGGGNKGAGQSSSGPDGQPGILNVGGTGGRSTNNNNVGNGGNGGQVLASLRASQYSQDEIALLRHIPILPDNSPGLLYIEEYR